MSPANPGQPDLERTACLLREGRLVALPTGTVHGLGVGTTATLIANQLARRAQ